MTLAALGHRIRTLRQGLGLSQAAVAEDAGLSTKYLSDLERGRRNPTFSTAEKVAKALGVGLVELVGGEREGDDEAVIRAAVEQVLAGKDPGKIHRMRVLLEEVFL